MKPERDWVAFFEDLAVKGLFVLIILFIMACIAKSVLGLLLLAV